MNTNTKFILAGLGFMGYLGYKAKVNAEALAAELAARNAAPPLPPNGGPVVNGLSLYQLEGLSGFGSSFKRFTAPVVNVAKKISPTAIVGNKVIGIVRDKKTPLDAMKKLPGGAALLAPLTKKIGGGNNNAQPAPGQAETFADINGKTITKAEYDAIVKSMNTMTPIPVGGGWAIPDGYIMTQAQYESSVYNKKKPIVGHPDRSPPIYYPTGKTPYGPNDWQSADASPGTAHTASAAGSPALPQGLTTSMAPPAVQEEQQGPPAESPRSNTAAALVGTALAAGAAFLAFS